MFLFLSTQLHVFDSILPLFGASGGIACPDDKLQVFREILFDFKKFGSSLKKFTWCNIMVVLACPDDKLQVFR